MDGPVGPFTGLRHPLTPGVPGVGVCGWVPNEAETKGTL